MLKPQFLLNPDGSLPPNTNVEALRAAGVPLVLPTPRWIPEPGMMLEESDAEQDSNGVWRQVWKEVPEPQKEQEPEPDPLASLTLEQKKALLALLKE